MFKEQRAQSPLYVIRDLITLPPFSSRFRDKSLRTAEIAQTKMKERFVRNTLMQAYKLAMKFNIISTTSKDMSHCSITVHLNMITKT